MLRIIPRINLTHRVQHYSTSVMRIKVIKSTDLNPEYNREIEDDIIKNFIPRDTKRTFNVNLLIQRSGPYMSIGKHVSNRSVNQYLQNYFSRTGKAYKRPIIRRMTGGCIKQFDRETMIFSILYPRIRPFHSIPDEQFSPLYSRLTSAPSAIGAKLLAHYTLGLPDVNFRQWVIDDDGSFTFEDFYNRLITSLEIPHSHRDYCHLHGPTSRKELNSIITKYSNWQTKDDTNFKVRFSSVSGHNYLNVCLDVENDKISYAQISTNHYNANIIDKSEKILVGMKFDDKVVHTAFSNLGVLDYDKLMNDLILKLEKYF